MSPITTIIPVIEQHYAVLTRAIESVKASTTPSEILVVNDGQTNLSLPDVQVIATGGRTGSAHARNVGVDACRTPLVFFLDADDYLVDNALEVLYKAWLEYPEACYLYGDWFQYGKNGDMRLHEAKPYDRVRLIRHTIHTVNILIGKETLQTVGGFDETFPAWEDYDLFIRLALQGYCGVRVPYPIIVYDMLLGVNREQHDVVGAKIHPQVIAKYKDYQKEEDFMPCATCGGNNRQQQQRNQQVNAVIPEVQQGMVTLEYIGVNTAPIRFLVNGRTYRGANSATHKYLNVPASDVQQLLERGVWRKAVRATKPTTVPQPQDFAAWREKNREANERAKQVVEQLQNKNVG